jgi:hypothetical protein
VRRQKFSTGNPQTRTAADLPVLPEITGTGWRTGDNQPMEEPR